MGELKQRYNDLLAQMRKAEKFLNDKSIPQEKRMGWVWKYNQLMDEIAIVYNQLGPMTDEEVWEGFK